jgi:teichoic acid glycerol-phosphate primase
MVFFSKDKIILKYMKKKIASLIYGNKLHYLDHLAPLSHFLNIPLIINQKNIFDLCKKYYPDVNCLYVDDLMINFHVVKNYDYIISCITKELFDNDFRLQQDLLKKEIEIIWTPHGASDKGNASYFFENLNNAKNIFVYGQKMLDTLKEKKVLKTINRFYEIGNYRLKYFEKYKSFYKKIIQKDFKNNLKKNNLNVLYAPTWDDAEKSSSFWLNYENLIKKLPRNFNLIIKLHPNLITQNEIKIFLLKEKNKKNNILFLDDFPIIYPLIDFVDVYLGDFSSIGYDFLSFRKPMFFLKSENKNLSSKLFECGKLIEDDNIYETIKKNLKNDFKPKQMSLYKYTFSETSNLEKILLNI